MNHFTVRNQLDLFSLKTKESHYTFSRTRWSCRLVLWFAWCKAADLAWTPDFETSSWSPDFETKINQLDQLIKYRFDRLAWVPRDPETKDQEMSRGHGKKERVADPRHDMSIPSSTYDWYLHGWLSIVLKLLSIIRKSPYIYFSIFPLCSQERQWQIPWTPAINVFSAEHAGIPCPSSNLPWSFVGRENLICS